MHQNGIGNAKEQAAHRRAGERLHHKDARGEEGVVLARRTKVGQRDKESRNGNGGGMANIRKFNTPSTQVVKAVAQGADRVLGELVQHRRDRWLGDQCGMLTQQSGEPLQNHCCIQMY